MFKLDPGKMGEQGQRDTILIDLFSSTLAFARDSKFSDDQASALFSIVKDLHDAVVRECAARTASSNSLATNLWPKH